LLLSLFIIGAEQKSPVFGRFSAPAAAIIENLISLPLVNPALSGTEKRILVVWRSSPKQRCHHT